MTVYAIAVLVIYLLFVAGTAAVARLRGADVAFWVRMAVIWGPFALPFALFSRRRASG